MRNLTWSICWPILFVAAQLLPSLPEPRDSCLSDENTAVVTHPGLLMVWYAIFEGDGTQEVEGGGAIGLFYHFGHALTQPFSGFSPFLPPPALTPYFS